MADIYVLGELRTVGGVQPGSLAPRTVALLTYLALHPGLSTPRQHLAALFWPDSSGKQARTNLRRELHKLRLFMPADDVVNSDGITLVWQDSPACRLDARIFQQESAAAQAAHAAGDRTGFLRHAGQALDEYRGELLPGSDDDWVLEQRSQLCGQYVHLCDVAARLWLDTGEHIRALMSARHRIQVEPLEEAGYRLLMEVHAAMGDRAAALNTYHRCASVLERELGVTPDPATMELLRRLLGKDMPSQRETARRRGSGSAGPDGGTPAKPAIVGRGQELAFLRRRWADAVRGTGAVVLISAHSGLGKSRLIEELAAQVKTEAKAVATARCYAASGTVGLAPVAVWLRNKKLARVCRSLEPLWQAEVRRLIPECGGRPDDGTGPAVDATASRYRKPAAAPAAGALMPPVAKPAEFGRLSDPWQRHRFFEGLSRAVLATGGPLLLVIDDVQWCDAETIAWLDFLLHFISSPQLLVVLAARPGELSDNTAVARSLRRMKTAGTLTELVLEPLTPDGTVELAEAIGQRRLDGAEAALLHAAAGGYPFYLVETARLLQDTAAAGRHLHMSDLREVLDRRLAELSRPARSIAALAASVGRDFPLELLSQASDLDVDTLVGAVDELWNRRILRTCGSNQYDFTHDAFREAAYGSASPAKQWLQHRQLAAALEVLYAGRQDEAAAQLAGQYRRAGQYDTALHYFQLAGEQAANVFAEHEALEHYGHCLELIEQLPPGPGRDEKELQIQKVRSAHLVTVRGYSSPELRLALERAEELAGRLHRPATVLASLIGQFAVRFVRGETQWAYRIGQRALDLAQTSPQFLGQAHFAVAGPALSLGRPLEAIQHFQLALDQAAGSVPYILGAVVEAHALDWAAHAYWLTGQDGMAGSVSADAAERARQSGHPFTLAITLAYAAVLQQFRGDTATLAETLDELGGLCERYGMAYYSQWWQILSGWLSGGSGGIDQIERGIRQLRSQGSFARMPYWLSLLAGTMVDAGRIQSARAVLDAAGAAAEEHDDRWWLPEVLRLRASLQTDGAVRISLLERAERMAAEQDSVALQRRCRADLTATAAGL